MIGNIVSLSDVCDISSSKRIFFSDYTTSGVPFYRSKEIIEIESGQQISEPLYISEDKYDSIKSKFGAPVSGDMLLTSVGTIGIPYIVRHDDFFYFKDGNLTWFRNFSDALNSCYLYYWIKSQDGQGTLYNLTIGSSQKALTISALKQLKINLPSRIIQDKIVSILSAYDDLIANNQKQIKLLEEAAQRLYKEWFIDLHFPGYENCKIVDGVPEGWSRATLSELCSLRKENIKYKDILPNTPYIGLEHMPKNDFCLFQWGQAEIVNGNKNKYLVDDIIFGKIRPYFHKVGFTLTEGVTSTDTFIIVPNDGLWGLVLLLVSSDSFVDYSYQTCKEGAKMPRADWNQLKIYETLIADRETQVNFEAIIHKITRKIKALALQIHNLQEARDRLLPKLMSGEIEL